MRRGEVRWYEFRPPDKRRPVLILTRDSAIGYLNEITVVSITSTVRGIRSEVVLGTEDGMPGRCAANFDHVHTVPKSKLGARIATLSADRMKEVGPALCFALGVAFDPDGRQLAEAGTEYVTDADNANAAISAGSPEEVEWVMG